MWTMAAIQHYNIAACRDGSAVEIVGLCKSGVSWLASMAESGTYPHTGVQVTLKCKSLPCVTPHPTHPLQKSGSHIAEKCCTQHVNNGFVLLVDLVCRPAADSDIPWMGPADPGQLWEVFLDTTRCGTDGAVWSAWPQTGEQTRDLQGHSRGLAGLGRLPAEAQLPYCHGAGRYWAVTVCAMPSLGIVAVMQLSWHWRWCVVAARVYIMCIAVLHS